MSITKKEHREHAQNCYHSKNRKEKAKEHYEDKKKNLQKIVTLSNKEKRKKEYRRSQ